MVFILSIISISSSFRSSFSPLQVKKLYILSVTLLIIFVLISNKYISLCIFKKCIKGLSILHQTFLILPKKQIALIIVRRLSARCNLKTSYGLQASWSHSECCLPVPACNLLSRSDLPTHSDIYTMQNTYKYMHKKLMFLPPLPFSCLISSYYFPPFHKY